MIVTRFFSLIFLVTLASMLHAAGDMNLGGTMISKNADFSADNNINLTGTLEGRETVNLEAKQLLGNGLIKGSKIFIKVSKFSFTGTIECSDECIIASVERVNRSSFKRVGSGKFIFRKLTYDVNEKSASGQTELIRAAAAGDVQEVLSLLKKGADVNVRDNSGATALFWAIHQNQPAVIEILMPLSTDIHVTGPENTTTLLAAVQEGMETTANYLINNGANVNAKGLDDITVLIWAANRGLLSTVKLLVEKGADVNAKTRNGMTAFDAAKTNDKEEVAHYLENLQVTSKETEQTDTKKDAPLNAQVKPKEQQKQELKDSRSPYDFIIRVGAPMLVPTLLVAGFLKQSFTKK